MIIINPVKDTRDPNTDAARTHINWVFASKLVEYIEVKGDEVRMSRYSEDAPAVTLESLRINYSPSVTITVDCYADFDSSVSGYYLLCDKYTALLGTINYELYMRGRRPITELGYKETGSLKYGQYTDITIYLGYVTNSEDLAYLKDEDNLDMMAIRIVEGAYGPPVKQIEDTDPSGNDDPYFYRISTWQVEDNEEGSTGTINETTYSGLPVRYLALNSTATGYYPVPDPPEGEGNSSDSGDGGEETEPVLIPRHYSWSTPLTYTSPVTCLFIGSVRCQGGEVTAYIKVDETEYTQLITDTTFTIVIFEAEVNPGAKVHIGVQGSGRLDYSGIWVAPKGSLGSLDDPRATYSIFPPGYRSVSRTSSAYNNADAIHIALTSAKSLLERAQDTTKPVIGSQITNEEALANSSSGSNSSSSGSNAMSFVFTTLGYANALSGLMNILTNFDASKLNIVDPSTINIDYQALENSISSIQSVQKKAEVLAAVNDIKTMSNTVDTATKTEEELNADAEEISTATQQRIEDKGAKLGSS